MPEYMSELSDRMPEYMPNKMPRGRPNRMPDGMPEYMPHNMSAGRDHSKRVILQLPPLPCAVLWAVYGGIIEGSLEVKLPTTWTGEKQRCLASPCFWRICGSGGSKSRPSKAAGAEPSGQMRDEKLHAAVARSR